LDFFAVAVVAFLASGLTLYSGFGLGTVLLPVFALMFPAPIAVAATGVVHLLNNAFKGVLLFRQADWRVVLRFGLPAVPAALLGAWVLAQLGGEAQVFTWSAGGRSFGPTPAGIAIGGLMILSAVLEMQQWFQRLGAPARLMPYGGALTGFIGGLTGQQGALRSMFLLKSGLDPARFVATGVMIAILIDISRLPVYAASFTTMNADLGERGWALVAVGSLSAFCGAYLGTRYLKKATIGVVRVLVTTMMLVIGAALIAGLIGS
jgi:uncharacterized membrane protein YfcA